MEQTPSPSQPRRSLLRYGSAAALSGLGMTVASIQPTSASTAEPDLNSYFVLATDYGVAVGGTSDQTAKLQSALDAAASTGATLLLPSGKIHLLGQLIWKKNLHSIVGTEGTELDWTGSSTDGPVFVVDGTRRGSPSLQPQEIVPAGHIEGVSFFGPLDSATTVDCVQYSKAQTGNHGSIFGLFWKNCSISGFRVQNIFLDGNWAIHHDGCIYSYWVDACLDWRVNDIDGEMIAFHNGLFANAPLVARAMTEGVGLDVNFDQCSLDYCNTIVKAKTGIWTFTGCHLETGGMSHNTYQADVPVGTGPLFDFTNDTSQTVTPALVLCGGVICLESTYTGSATPPEYIVVQTNSNSGVSPISVSLLGTPFRNVMTGCTGTVHREIGTAQHGDVAAPKIDIRAATSFRGNYSYGRPGPAANILLDSQFDSGTLRVGTSPSTFSGLTGSTTGWYVGQGWSGLWSTDSSTHAFGAQSLHFSSASSAPTTNFALSQSVLVQPMQWYHFSWLWKTVALIPGSGQAVQFAASFYRQDGSVASWGSRAVASGQFSATSTSGTHDWTFSGSSVQAPPDATLARVYLRLYGASGDLWLDDIQLSLT